MSTESNDSLKARIEALGIKVGNEVLGTDNLVSTPSANLITDSAGKLALQTASSARQSTLTGPMFTLAGKAVADVLVNTIVAGASVTTATKGAFVRVDLTTDDGTVTGSYYLELFTIT